MPTKQERFIPTATTATVSVSLLATAVATRQARIARRARQDPNAARGCRDAANAALAIQLDAYLEFKARTSEHEVTDGIDHLAQVLGYSPRTLYRACEWLAEHDGPVRTGSIWSWPMVLRPGTAPYADARTPIPLAAVLQLHAPDLLVLSWMCVSAVSDRARAMLPPHAVVPGTRSSIARSMLADLANHDRTIAILHSMRTLARAGYLSESGTLLTPEIGQARWGKELLYARLARARRSGDYAFELRSNDVYRRPPPCLRLVSSL